MIGHRPRRPILLPVFAGLVMASVFLPFLWVFLQQSGQLGRGAIIVFFVPLAAGPLLMLGFQRPAYSLLLAVVLGLLDWRLGGRFELFGVVLGITTNPSNIFVVLVFLQSFLWRSRRRMSRLFGVYALIMCAGAALGMFITADVDASTSAFIMRLIIPAGITINAIRSLESYEDLELVWLGVVVVAGLAGLYNMALGFSGELGFGRAVLGGNAFALTCACLMPVAVEWGLGNPRWVNRWVGRVTSIVFATQIWVQSSRTAIAVAGMFILATLVLRFRRILLTPLYLAMVTLVVLGGLGYYAQSRLVWAGAQQQSERFAEFFEGGFRGSNRWQVWTEAAEVIADSPLLGNGINAFTEASWLGFYGHPHQILMAIWLDAGPMGLLVFLTLMAYLCVATIRRTKRAPPGVIKTTCRTAMAMTLMLFATLQVGSYVYCGKHLIGTWFFHFVVASAFVAIALADEQERKNLQIQPGNSTA